MNDVKEEVKVNGEKVSKEKLKEIKEQLQPNERLVEVDKDEYRKLKRLAE